MKPNSFLVSNIQAVGGLNKQGKGVRSQGEGVTSNKSVGGVNLSMAWQLPEKYKNLDLWNVILDTFFNRLESLGYEEAVQQEAFARLFDEYDEIKRRGMVEFIRTVIYVLDTFREKGVVWGVGRGSSCASYTLFILGLHVVDCVCLKVPMEEFFHD